MFKEKLEELLIEAGSKIRLTRGALEYTVGKFRDLRSGATLDIDASAREGEIVWLDHPKRTEKRTTFGKESKRALDEGDHPALDILMDEIESIKSGRITPESLEIKDAIKELAQVMSGEMGSRLSYDYDTFMRQLHHLTLLFVFTKGEIKEINDLALDALFHAGQILERLKNEGKQRSDAQSDKRKKKYKEGFTTDQQIIKAYKEVQWKGFRHPRTS